MRCSRFASSLIPALVCLGVGCRDQEPGTASQVLSTARPGVSVARVRAAYYEALYRPDYIAAVSGKPVLCSVWRRVACDHRGCRHADRLPCGWQGHDESTATSRTPPSRDVRHRRHFHPRVGGNARRNGYALHSWKTTRGVESTGVLSVRM